MTQMEMFEKPSNDIDLLAGEVWGWAQSAFPDRTDASLFLKMYSEIAEVIRSGGEAMELADLFILLLDYAVRKDVRLADAIRQKLAINRQRQWKVNTDGTMSHVEE